MTTTLGQRALRWTLEHVSKLLPVRTIRGENGTPYLSKYRIGRDGGEHGCTLYLHKFHRSDMGSELHNHPWEWGISLILMGGYQEQYRGLDVIPWGGQWTMQPRVMVRDRCPGEINVILDDTFHRVDLLDEECWSLFLAGPKSQSWGFLDDGGLFTPWRDALKRRGIPIEEPWKPVMMRPQ